MELERFSERLGEIFAVDVGLPEPVEIVLTTATPLKPSGLGRPDPFELRFRGRGPIMLDQFSHNLRNEALGEMEIFLVPIGQEGDAFIYQAVFN